MVKILICDDEPRIRDLIKNYLVAEGFEIVEAANGEAVLLILEKEKIDLIILDIMMPVMDGIACLKKLRDAKNETPVIMLSAKGEEYDRVSGLQTGADDYVCKPFSPKELVARVRAVLNRTTGKKKNDKQYTVGSLSIDEASRILKIEDVQISITPKEFDLLLYLIRNEGIALSREKILQQVWNHDFYGEDRTVDTHIKMLRTHIGKYRNCIHTVWGVGYKFDINDTTV